MMCTSQFKMLGPIALAVMSTALSLSASADTARGTSQPDASEWKGQFDSDGYSARVGDMQLDIGGRLQFDVLKADSDARQLGTRSGLRRAGLNLSATWARNVELAAALSFDEDGAALSGLSLSFSAAVAGNDDRNDLRLRIGKFAGLVGMERRASSSDTLLMERGLLSALTSRSAWGASAGYAINGLSAEVAYFSDWNETQTDTRGSDGKGFAARLAYGAVSSNDTNGDDSAWGMHIGVSGEIREPDQQLYRVRARPEAELVDSRLLDTGLLTDVDKRSTYGMEAALLAGPVTLQAEYLSSTLDRENGSGSAGEVTVTGGYVQLGWVVTGESRRYRSRAAAIGGVRPEGHWGAVELVARYSSLDLEDGQITGGDGQVASAGVNWFVTRNVRLSLDAGRAEGQPNRAGNDEQINFVQARLQLTL